MTEELYKKNIKKEYIISPRLTVKLINNRTIIFVNGKEFNQCKYLLLNLTPEDIEKFEDSKSMDEIIELYKKENKVNEAHKVSIDPEIEFFGHCSNLQAWYDYGYNLNILHTNLSFPLLRELAYAGDKFAMIRFKEEIAKKILSKNVNTFFYLYEEEYLDLFSKEELEEIFNDWIEDNKTFVLDPNLLRVWIYLLYKLIFSGIESAKEILKQTILFFIKKDPERLYSYIHSHRSYIIQLDLKDLNEIFDSIDIKHQFLLKEIQKIIIGKYIRRRRK